MIPSAGKPQKVRFAPAKGVSLGDILETVKRRP